jgi:hypothetical protein
MSMPATRCELMSSGSLKQECIRVRVIQISQLAHLQSAVRWSLLLATL